ncbi:MAG: MBL fold metallo-hydrolase [Ferruginibacter sp.]
MNIFPLSEGTFTIDATKVFRPFDISVDDIQDRPRGSLIVEIQPFLIKINEENILIDTGLGFKGSNGELQIFENLASHNLKPEDITIVLISHLHIDHAGGIGRNDVNDNLILNFPNAVYYIHKKELDYAIEKGEPSYQADSFKRFFDNNKIKLLTEEEGEINSFIKYKVVGGHTPFGMAFWIENKSEIAFFGGDVAPQLQQMKRSYMAKYDFDGRKSMELRSEWGENAKAYNWEMLFYHDIKNPTYKY